MKTFVAIAAAAIALSAPVRALSAPVLAAPRHHVVHRHGANPDYYALSPRPTETAPAGDDCIGLHSGTSGPSCGATLTGGPSGGLN